MKKTLTRLGIVLIVLLIIIYCGLSWFFSGLILTPPTNPLKTAKIDTTEQLGAAYDSRMAQLPNPELFSLETEKGVTIKGWYFKQSDTANCGVVLAHGWSDNRRGMLRYVHLFDSCGCDMVLYDHRVHGQSGGKYPSGGIYEKEDLHKITDWFKEKTGLEDNQIGWAGASWGAGTVMQAGGNGREMAFILSDSPFQDWHSAIFERAIRDYGGWVNYMTLGVYAAVKMRSGINVREANTLEAIKGIKSPVFLLHSETDEATGSIQSVNISKHLNPENSVFHHTKWGAGHCKDITENKDKYDELFFSFLQEHAPSFINCE